MKTANKLWVVLLTAMTPAAFSASVLPPIDPSATMSVESRVLHELRMLPYYSVFDDLGFTVEGDRVTLRGEVTNPVLKTDALNAVRHLAGVSAVEDHIEVLPLSSFDRDIRRRTYFAIYGYGPLQRYGLGAWPSIHILVKNGNVRLVGYVDSDADRQMAITRANGVPDVFSVTNELGVQKSEKRR